MAPRRGGGGSFSFGGSSSSCPNAFSGGSVIIAYFVSHVIFFLVTLGILIATGSMKKKNPYMKKIANWVYVVILWLYLLGYALLMISTILEQCDTIYYYDTYYFAIAYGIFFHLAAYLLIYIVLVVVNTALRRAVGHNPSFLKAIYGAIMGILFVVWVTMVVLSSIQLYDLADGFRYRTRFRWSVMRIAVAWIVLYLIAVLVAGAGIIVSTTQLRHRVRTGSLSPWGFILALSMLIWVVFALASNAANLSLHYFDNNTTVAFEYIGDFFIALSLIAILFLAKSPIFSEDGAALPPNTNGSQPGLYPNQPAPVYTNLAAAPQHQQYAYAPQPQYQQTPFQQQQQQYAYAQPVQNAYAQPVQNAHVGPPAQMAELKTNHNAAELKS